MAHVDTDEHGAGRLNYIRELHREQVSTDFTVHLADDVGCLGGVERSSVPAGDYLRRNPVLVHHQLVHGVVLLISKETQSDRRVAELLGLFVLIAHQVLQKPVV